MTNNSATEAAADKADLDKIWPGCQCKNCRTATEIASLRERVKELEGIANCHVAASEARCRWLKDAQARAETAERELSRERETFQSHEQTLRDNGINSHSEAVVLVATLRQVFDDILDELGCERDNEAALEAIATLRRERDEARAQVAHFISLLPEGTI